MLLSVTITNRSYFSESHFSCLLLCVLHCVRYVIFIIPISRKSEENRLFDMWGVLIDTLINLGVDERWFPKDICVYWILRSEAKSYKRVRRI